MLSAAAARGRHLDGPEFGRAEHVTGLLREALDRHLSALEDDLGVLDNQTAAVAADFQTVGAGRLAGRRNEEAGRAVGILEIGRDLVLYLDVVALAEVAEGAHAYRHAAQPLQEVEIMRALVQQHAAALALPGGTPPPAIVVELRAEPVGDHPVHTHEIAQLAILDQLPHLTVVAVRALVEHRREYEALVGVRGDQALRIGLVDRDRLLNQQVLAALEGLDAHRGVGIVGGGDEHGINVAGGDQLGTCVKTLNIGGKRLHLLRHDIADGRQAQARYLAREDVPCMPGAHAAGSNDSKSDFFQD